jgi:hypothetical protein
MGGQDNIIMDLKEIECEDMDWIHTWLRIRSSVWSLLNKIISL